MNLRSYYRFLKNIKKSQTYWDSDLWDCFRTGWSAPLHCLARAWWIQAERCRRSVHLGSCAFILEIINKLEFVVWCGAYLTELRLSGLEEHEKNSFKFLGGLHELRCGDRLPDAHFGHILPLQNVRRLLQQLLKQQRMAGKRILSYTSPHLTCSLVTLTGESGGMRRRTLLCKPVISLAIAFKIRS